MPRIDLFYYGDTSPGQSAAELYRDIEEQVVLGDQLGYNGVWVTEHHLDMRGEIPDPLLLPRATERCDPAASGSARRWCAPVLPPDPARRVGALYRRRLGRTSRSGRGHRGGR